MLEVENAGAVVAGTLCYIKDTGGYYLPDRELTDEELLEIIEYDYKNGKTKEQMDAEDMAMEADIGEKAKELKCQCCGRQY